jgi:cytochrome c oxidase assembly protein subunit 15
MVAIAVWTGPRWWNAAPPAHDVARIRRTSAVTLGLVYLQVILGAWLRHFPSPLAAGAHVLAAAGVLGHAGLLVRRVEQNKSRLGFLVPSARTMAAVLAVQIALGLAAFWIMLPFDGLARTVSTPQALVRTGHQANGALLLACSVVLTLRAFRGLESNVQVDSHAVEASGTRSELEVIV